MAADAAHHLVVALIGAAARRDPQASVVAGFGLLAQVSEKFQDTLDADDRREIGSLMRESADVIEQEPNNVLGEQVTVFWVCEECAG